MKKGIGILVLVLIFILILLFVSIFFLIKSAEKNYAGNKEGTENKEDAGGKDSNKENNGGSDITGNIISNSGSDNNLGAGGNNGNQQSDKKNLPLDIESVECGFYFSGYGVCAGTCPSGKCTEEGRSCYCKNA